MIERLLTRLERRFGRLAFGHTNHVLLALQVIGLAIVLLRPDLADRLVLDRKAVLDGELWRLLSFLLSPLSTHPIWAAFALYWLFLMGSALEEHWGSFRYEVFWLVGIAATIASVLAGGSQATIAPLVMSLFLAFATLWPDYTLRVFFVLPVPVKWLALIDALGIAASIGLAEGWDKLVPIAAVANYLLFFGGTLAQMVIRFARHGAQGGSRARFRQGVRGGRDELRARLAERRCAICGRSAADPGVEIRVCSCEKCGGVDRDLCLEHVRSH